MIRAMAPSKGIFILIALGAAVMLMLACTSGAVTPQESSLPAANGSGQPGIAGGNAPPQGIPVQAFGQDRASFVTGAQAGVPAAATSGILVTGSGEASAAPDLAVLNLGVEAFAKTVAEARSSAAVSMGQVTGVLKARNIAERDIQTRVFDISPRYTTREVIRCPETTKPTSRGVESGSPAVTVAAPEPAPRGAPEGPSLEAARPQSKENCFEQRESVIIGFQVSNQLTVRLRELDSIGEVIDEVTAAGGDLIRFQGLNFTIEDPETLQDQARTAAIEDVMAKANQVASLTGVKLGKLVHISETSGQVRTPSLGMERAAFAVQSAPTPIKAGELEVTVTVQALYGIE